jgi:hypothetical protein
MCLVLLAACICTGYAQDQPQKTSPDAENSGTQDSAPQNKDKSMDMKQMDMPASQSRETRESISSTDPNARHAMSSMQGQMEMGPHMKMTPLRLAVPGDEVRAEQVAAVARKVADQYQDYRKALADGFSIFMPNVPQKQYHFTNYRYALQAVFDFNPERPTSLLYEKDGDSYKIVGVMYTAPKHASLSELDSRVPLSVAQWHAHINLCLPAKGQAEGMTGHDPQFGLAGSISSKDKCDAAGGRFIPQIFGWMVHVYPFEQNPKDVWSVERQMKDPD